MGNTESSMGLTFGSVIGGLILAPFTGGTSLGVAVAIGSGAGTAIGVSSATYNMLNNRDAPEDKKLSSFLIGAVGGVTAPVGGLAYGMGAEVTVGVGLAGIGGIGITNAGDGKIKPYIGNQEKAVEYYTRKEEKKNEEKAIQSQIRKQEAQRLNAYVESHFQTFEPRMTHTYILSPYSILGVKYKANLNFDNYKLINLIKNLDKYNKIKNNLLNFNHNLNLKIIYTIVSIGKIENILKTLQKEQTNGFKKAYCNLFSSVVYALNAIDTAKKFEERESMIAYAPYALEMDESFKNYCAQMKSAFSNFLNELEIVNSTATQMAKIENKVNEIYDKVAEAKAMEKNPMSRKYGIWIDGEKHKLSFQERINKINQYYNESKKLTFNSLNYHIKIYEMVKELDGLMK